MYKLLLKILNKLNYLIEIERQKNLRSKYNLPKSFRFNGKGMKFYGEGKLIIDEDSYIGDLSTIQLHEDHKVVIGRKCSISHNVRMYTSSKVPDGNFEFKEDVPNKYGDIIIGDYCWIGANVFINPGVNIGKNSVVGANSVVTKDLMANAIYGGVPAKLIREKRNID